MKVTTLLEALKQSAFPFNSECISAIAEIRNVIASSTQSVPSSDSEILQYRNGCILNSNRGVLSQAGRTLAFFCRSLSLPGQRHSSIERETLAVLEAIRKWDDLVRNFFPIIHYYWNGPHSRHFHIFTSTILSEEREINSVEARIPRHLVRECLQEGI